VKVTLQTPLERLRGVGPARARILEDVGFRKVVHLLLHLPYRYEDRREILGPAAVTEPGNYTLTGRLRDVRAIRVRRRRFSLVRGVLTGDGVDMPVVWFNRPYLARQVNEETDYLLHGAVRRQGGKMELVNPSCEPAERARHSGRVAPVYSSIGKLGPAFFRRVFGEILEDPALFDGIRETLPESLRMRYALPTVGEALRQLHLPAGDADVTTLNERGSPAHLRLIYGEFLELQLELALLRERQVREPKTHQYRVDDDLREVARAVLPFRLTGAQKRVLKEIVDDLQSDYPMLRLIQGDVGSGKTIVGALSLVVAVESGLQGAFMAPTELLAEQQYRSFVRLLGDRYRIGLFTSSVTEIEREREALANGEIHIAVGTHSLIQKSTQFRALGLGIIDEQHRFGVAQRQLLQSKGDRPDMLVMTATPIPRSLALTVYGDLALSVIDELPPGRQPIETRVVGREKRDDVYGWLNKQLTAGGRAYIVCPLIEESDQIDAPSVEVLEADLRRRLVGQRIAVLHGRIAPDDRDKIMRCFASGEFDVLLATTIIEVGVDVPEATVMVIEGAERFGLAQLHQLRGRVGRGEKRSFCVALHGPLSEEGVKRLAVFGGSSDGFKIAEADLDIRGPGDLLGTRQAGLPIFRAADLLSDTPWLERARADAREILSAETIAPEYDALMARVEPRVTSRYERFAGG